MVYVKPEVKVLTQKEIDEIISAAACGSAAGSCYGGCNGKDCKFSV